MTTSPLTRTVSAATILNGFLAGASLDRTFIQLPAFRRAGVRPWAAFSREADLQPRAAAWYPTLAIGGAALSITAALGGRSSEISPASRRWLLTAATLATAGLLATLGAAPNMLRVRHAGDDAASLQRSFDGFKRWQEIRGPLHALAFLANVRSLVAIHAPRG
jgi:hypothetical protein